MAMKKLGFVFQSAPHTSNAGREGLDALLAASAYSEDIRVFFIGNGTGQLLANQQPEKIKSRDYIATFKMLDLYDIEQIFFCQQSLIERGFDGLPLILDAEAKTTEEIKQLMGECDRLLMF